MASLSSLPEEIFENVEQAVIIVEASPEINFLFHYFLPPAAWNNRNCWN